MRLHRLIDSFNYAVEGLVHTVRTQRNMKIHFSIAFIVLLCSLFFEIESSELLIIFMSITFVIAAELLNTAVEIITDMISPEYRYKVKLAKNVAAAAVLIAAINAVFAGYIIFVDELQSIGFSFILKIREDPIHMIFITLGLLIIIIIALKAYRGRGTPLEGGMPSGHSALAFAVTSMIIFFTMDIVVSTLAVFLAILVIQSRLQSRIHSMSEVIIGALIGILFTLALLYFF